MQRLLLFIFLVPTVHFLAAQDKLYISPGASLHLDAGATLTIDSMVLIPSVNFDIAGANSLLKATTTIHASGKPYIQRVYRWSNTLPPFSGTLGFYYRDGELNGIAEQALTLNVHNGISWNAYINNVVRDANLNYVATPLNGVSLNEWTLAALTGALPMQWLGVEASRRNNDVLVSWRTANEFNCADYRVEKSSNGLDWTSLGAPVSAYNLSGPNQYSLTDAALPAPVSHYRIRQTDLDARYVYSPVVSVRSDRANNTLVYPIPAGEVLNIMTASGLLLKSVTVFSATGSLVVAERPAGASMLTLNLQRLAAGQYTAVIVLSDNSSVTRPFIKK